MKYLGMLGIRIRRRARLLLKNDLIESEIREELEAHVEMETETLMERGMSRRDARRAALVAFGGLQRINEMGRDAYGGRSLQAVVHAYGYAGRALTNKPTQTAVVAVSLAVGLACAGTFLSLAEQVLFRPLPFPNPERIELIRMREPGRESSTTPISPRDFGAFTEGTAGFSRLAAFSEGPATLRHASAEPLMVLHVLTTPSLFELLSLSTVIGRGLEPGDGVPDAAPVAVIGYDTWTRHFDADTTIVGHKVAIDGSTTTVIGVLSPGLSFPVAGDIWSNYRYGFEIGERHARWLSAIGRLETGVTRQEAHDDLSRIAARLGRDYPYSNRGWGVAFRPITETIVGPARALIGVPFGAAGLLFLLAVTNVAGMLLTQARTRYPEFALRQALGASREDVRRQVWAEVSIFAVIAVLVAVGVELLLLFGIQRFAPSDVHRLDQIGFGIPSLGILLLVGLSVTIALAILVMRLIGPSQFAHRIVRGAPTLSGQVSTGFLCVGLQVTIVTILIIATGVFGLAYRSATGQANGFDPEGLVVVDVTVPVDGYPLVASVSRFYDELLDLASGDPRVELATLSSTVPFGNARDPRLPYAVVPASFADPGPPPVAVYRKVAPGFFSAFSIPLVAGRGIRQGDNEEAPGVAVISQALARRHWRSGNAVGQRMEIRAGNFGARAEIQARMVEIVGVAGDVRFDGPMSEPEPSLYLSHQQAVFPSAMLVLKSKVPNILTSTIMGTLTGEIPEAGFGRPVDIETLHGLAVGHEQFSASVLFGFSVVALVMAFTGLFGTVLASASRKSREIAVKRALGASTRRLFVGITIETLEFVIPFALLGVVLAGLLSKLLQGTLFAVPRTDPRAYFAAGAVVCLLGFSAVAAGAWRAIVAQPIDRLDG